MRIGVVTTSYPRWPDDPAGNFVAAHVAALRERGHTVDVIAAGETPSAVAAARSPTPDGVTRIASPLFYTGGAPDLLEQSPRPLASVAFTARLAAAVQRQARTWDTIVAHWLAPSALAALPTRAPLLAIAHGGDVHTLRRARLLAPALHLLHARRAELAFVSSELRDICIRAAPLLAHWLVAQRVQPMGIDSARFAAIPRAPTQPPTLAVLARLVPIKGVDVAIAAHRLLARPTQLAIAGDGPLRTTLRAKTSELLGALDTRARDALLGRASIVLVPSRTVRGRSEGTPLVAIEALAAGVPVIASAVGGLRDVPGVTLVRPDDPHTLAAAITRVLDAPPRAADLRAQVADLDWRTVADNLVRRQ